MSTNPGKRLKFHNIGKSGGRKSFTKRANDWEIVYEEIYNNKSEALKREIFIKRQKSRKFIENLISSQKLSTESCAGQ